MSAKRKAIRNEVVSILKKYQVGVPAENIKANRSSSYESAKLPAISVYTREDAVEKELATAPRLLQKYLELVIEVVVTGSKDDAVADQLDDMTERVERALSADDSLDNKASDILLQRTSFDFVGENVDKPLHTAVMVYRVTYQDFAPRDSFDQNLKPFEQINADWNIGHHDDEPSQHEDNQASDVVELDQE